MTEEPATDGSDPKPAIRLVEVSKSFGKLSVLDRVSIRFNRGQTVVILGPSGTGKSVLLKHIAGLLRPDSGEVWFGDKRIDQLSDSQLVDVRIKIGFLFQMGALFDSMSVSGNICFPLLEHTKMTARQRADRCCEVLSMVGMAGSEQKMPSELSGGQRKRVAMARAISLQPEVVLYDEPTTGLDPVLADVINELIIILARRMGITSVVVTHDMASALKIADRIMMLYDGRVIADADTSSFMRSDDERVRQFVEGRADRELLDHIRGVDLSP